MQISDYIYTYIYNQKLIYTIYIILKNIINEIELKLLYTIRARMRMIPHPTQKKLGKIKKSSLCKPRTNAFVIINI